jgi:hypothetical protein
MERDGRRKKEKKRTEEKRRSWISNSFSKQVLPKQEVSG